MTNKLYYGDNLDILKRYAKDESVDLVYLDPPFNSNQYYNAIFTEHTGDSSKAQLDAFKDTWCWNGVATKAYEDLVLGNDSKISQMMQAFRTFLGENSMMAYLAMMAPRLIELRRVLKETGSIYLHCDPTASHYLKLLMDAIFGGGNFRNEVVWCYRSGGVSKRWFGRKHQNLLFYTKSNKYNFNPQRVPYVMDGIKKDEKGLYLMDKGKRIDFHPDGAMMPDWWNISYIGSMSKERLGYPTQKPLTLLECIIKASSKEGDLVLDPFCGGGTTLVVAQKLGRKWIGIDITHIAIATTKRRLDNKAEYKVIGEPTDLSGAKELAAKDRYQFQWWALELVKARPAEQKKGADKGIDGRLYFHDGPGGRKTETKQIIFSVKAGHTDVSHVRDLRGVIERENAQIGVLICMQEPTKSMEVEAASAGFYKSHWKKPTYPKLQIITVKELLDGKTIDRPVLELINTTFERTPGKKER